MEELDNVFYYFSPYIGNHLYRHGITTMRHLCSFKLEEIFTIKGVGERSLSVISNTCYKYLKQNGLEEWNMPTFTLEEINLMCIYDTSNRNRLWLEVYDSLKDVHDLEMRELMQGVLAKLHDMTDEEFSQIGFTPDYGDKEEG